MKAWTSPYRGRARALLLTALVTAVALGPAACGGGEKNGAQAPAQTETATDEKASVDLNDRADKLVKCLADEELDAANFGQASGDSVTVSVTLEDGDMAAVDLYATEAEAQAGAAAATAADPEGRSKPSDSALITYDPENEDAVATIEGCLG